VPGPLRLLLVDDDENDEALLLAQLQRSGWTVSCQRVDTGEAMDSALARQSPDLIISDNRMPAFSALEALEITKKRAPEVPFVIVSGTIGEEQAVGLIKAGARDFLLKDRLSRLDSAVERALSDAADRRALRRLEVQLQEAQRMESIGRMAGGIAHDFNNILTVIQAEVELLLQLPMNAPPRSHLERIRFAGERAGALTQQLLAFSRGGSAEVRPIDLNQCVDAVLPMLDRLVGERIAIEVHRGHSLGLVAADPVQVEQILMNLVANARDAMPMGGLLTIATADESPAAGPRSEAAPAATHVRLTVSDSGVGIPAEIVARIFEPYFTTKESGKGTGLGLATVYAIVQRSGGSIEVRSVPGQGATFEIRLPRLPQTPGPSHEAPQATGGDGRVVLLTDDEPALREVIRRLLESRGFRVLATADAEEALATAERHDGTIDLVLTDVGLIGMQGPQLVARLCAARPGIRALYMSGESSDSLVSRGILEPGVEVIGKPFSLETILRKVRDVIEK
jgi:two-component system, cell cycle sensor histidine kinase and response regulator CckA